MKFKVLFAIFGIFLLAGCDPVEEVAPVEEEAEEVVEKVVPEEPEEPVVEPIAEPVVITPKPAEITVPAEAEVEAEAASEESVVKAEAASEPVEAKEIVLAKCMTASGAKLYTAEWCGHCQNQKAAFGEGLQYIDNTECASDSGWTQECTDAGVKAVPTWILGDGKTQMGNTPLATLASLSGCTY